MRFREQSLGGVGVRMTGGEAPCVELRVVRRAGARQLTGVRVVIGDAVACGTEVGRPSRHKNC